MCILCGLRLFGGTRDNSLVAVLTELLNQMSMKLFSCDLRFLKIFVRFWPNFLVVVLMVLSYQLSINLTEWEQGTSLCLTHPHIRIYVQHIIKQWIAMINLKNLICVLTELLLDQLNTFYPRKFFSSLVFYVFDKNGARSILILGGMAMLQKIYYCNNWNLIFSFRVLHCQYILWKYRIDILKDAIILRKKHVAC